MNSPKHELKVLPRLLVTSKQQILGINHDKTHDKSWNKTSRFIPAVFFEVACPPPAPPAFQFALPLITASGLPAEERFFAMGRSLRKSRNAKKVSQKVKEGKKMRS